MAKPTTMAICVLNCCWGGEGEEIQPFIRFHGSLPKISITFGGAIYLGLVALLPVFLISGFNVQAIPGIGPALHRSLPEFLTQGLGVKFYFGGTSLLIVVGVAMDTVQQVESQLIMRHYDGFLKGARVRGRRF